MDPIYEIELQDCPICRGVGAMQDEAWATEPAGYAKKGRKALLSVLFAAQPPFEHTKLPLHCALNRNGLY